MSTLKDPGIIAFLEEGAKLYPADAVDFTMAQQRAFYDTYCSHFAGTRPSGVTVEDFLLGSVKCRRYVPRIAHGNVLYLHGGGFVLGGLESHDSICADLAAQTGLNVTAVEYSLAPEHPFPTAFNECFAVLQTLGPCIVAGDSAGGNLAAALCLKARDEGLNLIMGQVLIYPGLGGDVTRGSYISQAHAPGLSTADSIFYRNTYAGGDNKYASPLRETDYRNLPPAFLVACAHDPLHDDCFDYAAKLHAAGVAAEVRDEPELIHAFLRARSMSEPAAASFKAIVAALKAFATLGHG